MSFLSLALLIFTMRAKVQLTPFGYELSMERTSQNPSLIGRIEEAPSNTPRKASCQFFFKLAAFDLPPSSQPIPFSSKDSHLRFERFIGRNPFDLHTKPSIFSYFLPFFPLLSSLFCNTPFSVQLDWRVRIGSGML